MQQGFFVLIKQGKNTKSFTITLGCCLRGLRRNARNLVKTTRDIFEGLIGETHNTKGFHVGMLHWRGDGHVGLGVIIGIYSNFKI